jgi:hypothetical protein
VNLPDLVLGEFLVHQYELVERGILETRRKLVVEGLVQEAIKASPVRKMVIDVKVADP